MRKIMIFMLPFLFGITVLSHSLESGDYLKAAPVTGKILLPLAFIPEMAADQDAVAPGIAALCLFTLPNSFLMYNIATENPEGTAFWRKATLFADAGTALSLFGGGIVLLTGLGTSGSTGGWNIIAGGMLLLYSIPVFAMAGLDTKPYSYE